MVNTQTSPIIVEQIDDEVSKSEHRMIVDEPAYIPIKKQTPSQTIVTSGCQTGPPYPERLSLSKQSPHPEFEFLGELQKLFVKISLL